MFQKRLRVALRVPAHDVCAEISTHFYECGLDLESMRAGLARADTAPRAAALVHCIRC